MLAEVYIYSAMKFHLMFWSVDTDQEANWFLDLHYVAVK